MRLPTGTAFRWLALACGGLAALLVVAFGLLQTRPGKDLLAAAIGRIASSPNTLWRIDGLGGAVPSRMTARRITVSDAAGEWLTLRGVELELAPAALLSGELHVRLLRAAEVDQARRPGGPSTPLAELLRVPHLPFALVVDRIAVDRLALGAPVLGAGLAATVAGERVVGRAAAKATLDIRRIDTSPGSIALNMTLAGAAPHLSLQLEAREPTGVLLAAALGRADRLPLTLSLEGDGPLADWHGRLAAAAGREARLDADLALGVSGETTVALSASADPAPLLPPALAPLVGERARLSLHAVFGERIVIDRLSFAAATGRVTGDAAFGRADGAVTADLRGDLPDLSKFAAITGDNLRGSATLTARLRGPARRPTVDTDLSASDVAAFGGGAKSVAAHLAVRPTGPLDDRQTRVALDAHGRIAGLALPAAGAFGSRFAQGIGWSLAAQADPVARAMELTKLDVQGGGLDLTGSGRLAAAAHGVTAMVTFSAAANGLRTGIAAVDCLLGAAPIVAGVVRRDAAGILSLDDIRLTGAAANLTGNARLDPAREATAALSFNVPRLEALRPALGADIGGALSARVSAEGPLDRLRLRGEIDGHKIAAAGAALDRARFTVAVADLSRPSAVVDGRFRAGGLDGGLALTAAPTIGNAGVAIDRLRLNAGDGAITGGLRIAFAGGLAQGSLTGRLPDLSRWSALAGRPLAGSLGLAASFAAAGGRQGLTFTLDGAHLAVGAGSSRTEIGRVAASARLVDVWRAPSGSGRLSLGAVHTGLFDFATAAATFDSRGPGRFAVQGSADGRPLTVMFAGDGGLTTGGAELRLARLSGSLDGEPFALDEPLGFSRRGSDLSLSGLALRVGKGRVTATGSVRGGALAFTFKGDGLPIAAGARLIGHPEMRGELALDATLGGNLRAPRGHFDVHAAGVSLAMPSQLQAPRLGLTVEGDWNGRSVDASGQVTGLTGDRMAFTGSLPLLLNSSPLGISVPAQGRLAFSLRGGGDIGHLADLLPLGEDRLSGQFSADVSVGGTVAAPSAAGQLRLSSARYENFGSGAVLSGLNADLVGTGEQFRLATLTAGDGACGSQKAEGTVALGGTTGPSAQLSATLANFRIAARDEAQATASGTVSVAGPLRALKITAPLTINRAEIDLPTSLPPSLVVLNVTEVNGAKRPGAPPHAASATSLPATLDITLGLAGPVVVQGHGLDSQWSGRLRIGGTTAAPRIAGTLKANRGSYALLGKSFRLTRGTISFDGTSRIDPALDIVAEASAADITADATIAGYASAPTISLSSTPPMPKDEILARLLFGTGVRQMTAGQGLELAEAAAALAGNGPGMLDRLRGGLGLDWLRLGQGPAGAASSILNPSVVTPATTSTTALSAGKYIAPGVSVGVTQGVSPPTSKVTVEVDVGHHVTVDTEAGQNSGTGIGLNYNYDY